MEVELRRITIVSMTELVHASTSSSHHLKVVNWNVLGDCYAFGQDNASNMGIETLLWEYR